MEAMLAALLVSALRVMPVFASDAGLSEAVAAIRHDLPLLLAAPFQDKRVKPTIDWIVTDGRDAVAMWHSPQHKGVVALQWRSDRWWWRGAAVATNDTELPWTQMWMPGIDLSECGLQVPSPPSATTLLEDGFIDETLARELSSRLPPTPMPGVLEFKSCTGSAMYLVSTMGGSEATFFHHEEYAAPWFTWTGRTLAPPEDPAVPSVNVYYAFTLGARPDDSEHDMQHLVRAVYRSLFPTPPPTFTFARGSRIDIWFPYVLPDSERYVLKISNVVPNIDGVPGTLKNNVLHVRLPAFTLRRGDVANGEVDGKPVENAR